MKIARIVVADHQQESLNHLVKVLTQAGHQVKGTLSGKDAQKLVLGFKPHVCVIDPEVTGVDGFTLSLRIRRKFPKTRVIISTATYKEEQHRQDARTKYGVNAYLVKPYSGERLLRIIERLLTPKKKTVAPGQGLDLAKTAKAAAHSGASSASAVGLGSTAQAARQALDNSGDRTVALKGETQPGLKLQMDLESTQAVSSSEIDAHLAEMKEQLVLKPEAGKSIIDDLEFTDLEVTVGDNGLNPIIKKSAAISGGASTTRKEAVGLGDVVLDPNSQVDDVMVSRFERLEKSAQEAANERQPAFEPSDTLISGSTGDYGLTADEIFGGLIDDIESGRINRPPPGAKPIGLPKRKEDEITLPDQEPAFSSVGGDTNPDQAPGLAVVPHSPDRTEKYELLELISEDQAFEIWKAKIKGEKGFERIFALKKIKSYLADNPELNTLFLKEAKLAAALSHPNIVQIYELGEYEGSRFLAREFLQGESLQSILIRCRDQNATMPQGLVAFLASKIADALTYAHNAMGLQGEPLNIVHHHLSPDNVIVSDEGEVKVLNFGTGQVAARAVGTDMVPLDQLQSLAPEQAAGGTLDHRVDLFSLGSLMYRALTGLDPFTGTGRESVMMKIREANAATVNMVRPDISLPLSDIIARAMQGDPNLRYQSAQEIATDLRNFLKKEQQRLDDADVAAYLRTLRAGLALESPTSLPSDSDSLLEAPSFQLPSDSDDPTDYSFEPEVEFPFDLDDADDSGSGSGAIPAPGVDNTAAMVKPPEPAASGSSKGLVILLIFLIIVLLGLVGWKFVLPALQKDKPTPAPVREAVQPDPDLAQPMDTDTSDGVTDPDAETLDASEADDSGTSDAPPVDTTDAQPVEGNTPSTGNDGPPPTTDAAPPVADPNAAPPTELDLELKRLQDELRRKKEQLNKLNKDNKNTDN